MIIENPILTGSNPDPCALSVGNDYYIATSTFEWFPGVQIYHSTNLRDWKLIARPLEHLDMRGIPASCGIWAPCLSYSDGNFYLIYTVMKSFRGVFRDCHNYLVTAKNICGPWSAPVYLHSKGYDPSLFHDTDGRKWLLSVQCDYRYNKDKFGGIIIQEYSEKERKLIGESKIIYTGTKLGKTEAAHIYKKDGFYYLVTAEGGTEFAHAVMAARSKEIFGPYEIYDKNPVLTSLGYPNNPLQKSGHGSLMETKEGNWYLVHLAARPVGAQQMCILGRETCIQKVQWRDGWFFIDGETHEPEQFVEIEETHDPEVFAGLEEKAGKYYMKDDFENETWDIHLQSLRYPLLENADLKKRKGWLRLYGRESLESDFNQSLLAHRQQHFYCQVTAKMDFEPHSWQQMAGLVYYYDRLSYYYLHVTANGDGEKRLNVLAVVMGRCTWPIGYGIPIDKGKSVFLRIETKKETAVFSYSLDGKLYQPIGPSLDAVVLSDDYYYKFSQCRFTGAFIGICCQDFDEQKEYADFDFFEYCEM